MTILGQNGQISAVDCSGGVIDQLTILASQTCKINNAKNYFIVGGPIRSQFATLAELAMLRQNSKSLPRPLDYGILHPLPHF